MFKYKNIKNYSAGFTLIEIIIAIGIVSGVVFVISMFGLDIYDFSLFIGENLISQQEIQLSLRTMVSETRSMAQSVNGSYLIESASQNSLIFYSDIDGDGLTDRVHYFLDGNVLKRGVIKPTGAPLSYPLSDEKITEQVHNIYASAGNIFDYHGSSYSGTGSALTFPVNIPAIRLIKINITVDPNPSDSSSRVNFSDSVNIRNL